MRASSSLCTYIVARLWWNTLIIDRDVKTTTQLFLNYRTASQVQLRSRERELQVHEIVTSSLIWILEFDATLSLLSLPRKRFNGQPGKFVN